MSRSIPWSAVALVAALASSAQAGAWSLGTHLGASVIDSGEAEGSTGVWALPSNVLVYQPAFRLAYGDSRHRRDLQADAGVVVMEQVGSTLSLIVGSMSYQHVFMGDRVLGPMINVGVGFLREGGAARTTVAPSYGLGVGVRRAVREGHGAVRAELRWDRLGREESIGRPKLDTFGLRVGFDLWL